ncbi:unnamed protein product [Urochloa humidicola]
MKDLSLSGEKNRESTHVGCVPKGMLSEVENNVPHSLVCWDGCSKASSARLKFAVAGKNIITTFSVSTEYNELGYHSGSGTSSCLELSAQGTKQNFKIPLKTMFLYVLDSIGGESSSASRLAPPSCCLSRSSSST